VGVNSFEFEGSPPDPSKIPLEDVLGVAALILTGSYNDQEFVRVGYYQNTEYDNEEMKETPPQKIMFERLVRDISTKPRVTRFQIKWCVFNIVRKGVRQRLISALKGCCACTARSGGSWCSHVCLCSVCE
jgi:histone chaperone ASF1